jgi:hypothetical protein
VIRARQVRRANASPADGVPTIAVNQSGSATTAVEGNGGLHVEKGRPGFFYHRPGPPPTVAPSDSVSERVQGSSCFDDGHGMAG